jgi:hypothetical protein
MPNTVAALNYGLNWLTGQKIQSHMLDDTGNSNLDYTRIGFWLLGEGEMDGLNELWDSALGRLLYLNENDNPTQLHFHPGCDSVVGSGQIPTSTGGDQGVDTFWSNLLSGQQVLHYNRWAYYAIQLKQLINNPPNTNQNDASVWADVNPIGMFRGIRCRIFDGTGAMIGYAFTRNPVWHYVDLLCRRKLFPEYLIDAAAGAQDLPNAVRNRFIWSALVESAEYFGEILASTGRARFTGDFSFSQQTSLQACVAQMLTCCRGYQLERGGQYALVADKPRASVFTFTRKNADSFTTTDVDLHTAPNTYIAKFKDLLAPAFAVIASIICGDLQNPVVTTLAPHCANVGDYLVIGNTGTAYDNYWQVDSVPAPDSAGNVYEMTLKTRGSNYPTYVGAVGGLIGFRYSRFKDRAPQFQHKAHQYARGAVGVGIPLQRNRVSVTTDFANSTWDQVARVTNWQRGSALGPDVQPYVSPISATLKAPLFAPDAAGSGAVALQIEPGDVVTVDDTLSTSYAGEYEVVKEPITLTGSSGSDAERQPVGGGMQLSLRPYDPNNYLDDVAFSEPGWPDVPTLPINNGGTVIPLADGELIFFSGTNANGESFQVPDGFNQNFLMCWASPQGFIDGQAHLHYVQDCDAYLTRKLALIYNDGSGATWTGDVNWCAIAWRTQGSARKFYIGGYNFVEFTLLGGEKILFGKAIAADTSAAILPPGYNGDQTIPFAFPKTSGDVGHPTQGVGAFVEQDGTVHFWLNDDDGNFWGGTSQVMIVGFLNNNGGWKVLPALGWYYLTLPNGKVLALGGFSIWDARATPGSSRIGPNNITLFPVPTGGLIPVLAGMPSTTLQTMTGPNGFELNGGGHPAHGVKQCSIDGDNSYCSFEDGSGNTWYGCAGVFGLLCDTPTAALGGTPFVGSGASPWQPTPPVTGGGGGGTGGGSGGGTGGSGGDPGSGSGWTPGTQ